MAKTYLVVDPADLVDYKKFDAFFDEADASAPTYDRDVAHVIMQYLQKVTGGEVHVSPTGYGVGENAMEVGSNSDAKVEITGNDTFFSDSEFIAILELTKELERRLETPISKKQYVTVESDGDGVRARIRFVTTDYPQYAIIEIYSRYNGLTFATSLTSNPTETYNNAY